MTARQVSAIAGAGVIVLAASMLLGAQVPGPDIKADYDRANALRDRVQNKIYNVVETPTWIEKTSRLWYRKPVKGGNVFVLVDAAVPSKGPAFDHEKPQRSRKRRRRHTLPSPCRSRHLPSSTT
jgi:hypothetical protein